MFPFQMYPPQQQNSYRGRSRGRPFRGRRGRGNFNNGANSRFNRDNRPEPTISEIPPEKRDEQKKEVKEVTKSIPGVVLTSCQMQLSITLRHVGFLVQELFYLLVRNNVDVQCTCYQLYRIMLYSVDLKILKQSKRATPWISLPENRPHLLERIQDALETDLRLPKPFVDYLNSIGDFELNSVYYNVFVPPFEGPNPLYTTIGNLWGTAAALANPMTPLAVRQLYYINNSLPGAIWVQVENPLLHNPNAYIDQNYDFNAFNADLAAINALNTALRKRRWPELQAEKVDFTKSGDAAQLVSSTLMESVVRCANVLPMGQFIEGNRTDFCITSPGCNSAQAFKGACNLYSEVSRMNGAVPVWDNNRASGYQQLRVDWRSELRKLFTTA